MAACWGPGEGERETDGGTETQLTPGLSVEQQEHSGAINQNKHFRRKTKF